MRSRRSRSEERRKCRAQWKISSVSCTATTFPGTPGGPPRSTTWLRAVSSTDTIAARAMRWGRPPRATGERLSIRVDPAGGSGAPGPRSRCIRGLMRWEATPIPSTRSSPASSSIPRRSTRLAQRVSWCTAPASPDRPQPENLRTSLARPPSWRSGRTTPSTPFTRRSRTRASSKEQQPRSRMSARTTQTRVRRW